MRFMVKLVNNLDARFGSGQKAVKMAKCVAKRRANLIPPGHTEANLLNLPANLAIEELLIKQWTVD